MSAGCYGCRRRVLSDSCFGVLRGVRTPLVLSVHVRRCWPSLPASTL